MRGKSQGAARRYARALLDVALAKGVAAEVRAGLDDVAAQVAAHRQLGSLLAHPGIPAASKKALLAALVPKDEPGTLVARLLELLVERDRLEALPRVAEIYAEQWNAQRGVVAATAVSAAPLEPEQQKALEAALEAATGQGVELSLQQDPALLGGLLVRMQGRVYDGSVRARLAALKQHLVGTPHA